MNPATRAVHLFIASDWLVDGATEIQNSWHDVGQASAVEVLAKQLKRDVRECIRGFAEGYDDMEMVAALALEGMRAVKWETIAHKLLRQLSRADEQQTTPKEDSGPPEPVA